LNRHSSGSDLEATVQELTKRLDRIEDRLRALETASAGAPAAPTPTAVPAVDDEIAPAADSGRAFTAAISLVGRTLVVLGGGFLLRAVTEAEILSRSAGTMVALVYAVVWFILADVAGGKGNARSAFFHGLAGILIGFPLLWEASRTYGFLSPTASIAVATAVGMIALAVAWRRNLRILAWIASLSLAVTLFSLSWGPGALIPAASCLILLGLVTLWIGYIRDWFGLVWFTAFLVDVVVLMIALLLLVDSESEVRFGLEPRLVIAVQVFAVLGYLGSIVGRTLFRNRDVILLEVLQTVALLFLGLGGAVYVARSNDLALMPLGLACIALSAGSYGVGFTVLDRRVGGRTNFIYYCTLAIVLALISGAVFLETTALSLVFVALALLTRWFGLRYSRVTLAGHSVFYILAAALWSGLIASGTNAWMGSGDLARWGQGPALIVLASGLVIGGAPVSAHRRTWGPLALAPQVVLFILLVYSLDGIVVAALNRLLTGGTSDAAVTATIRTVVLAVSAFALAWIGRFERSRPASWLVYPFLVVGGLKLLVEDLPTGRPVTLFVSLAVYGVALIVTPRMLRKRAAVTES
jgi:hypothetical protein